MINEFYSVLLGYQQIGKDIDPVHGDIQEPGKGTNLRVLLDEGGSVVKVSLLKSEDFSDIWTIGNGNKNQFPCIKLVYPLRPNANEVYEKWKKENSNPSEAKLLDIISTLRSRFVIELPVKERCWPGYRGKIAERAVQLTPLQSGCSKVVLNLYQRYLSAPEMGLNILRTLDLVLWKTCQENPKKDLLKVAAALMFGEGLKKGLFPDGKRITLTLDVQPDPDLAIFATSRRYILDISKALNTNAKVATKVGLCPLLSVETDLLKDKFPRVKTPVIGNVNLYSRYDGSGNQSVLRYGKARSDSYSVGSKIAGDLAAVLYDLTAEKYYKKTWDSLPSGRSDSDLLIMFCRHIDEALLTVFVTGEVPKDIEEKINKQKPTSHKQYLRYCESGFEAMQQNASKAREHVDIVILRKINDGNQKVVYSTSQSLQMLINSAREWDIGCHNLPPLKLLVNIAKQDKLISPWTVSPKVMIQNSDQTYIRGGNNSVKVQAFSFADVMRLFLVCGGPVTHVTSTLLTKLVVQFGSLMEKVAKAKIQRVLDKKALVISDSKSNEAILIAASMFGLILYKRQRTKERYMDDFAFKLGQLCAAADEVHLAYCQGVRNGQIPSTLLGNQSYGIALNSPLKALALFAMRLKPYQSWISKENQKASQVYIDKETPAQKAIRNGLFAHRWIENESELLRGLLVHNQICVDDQYRAELMLGYLAGRPYSSKKSVELENEKQGE